MSEKDRKEGPKMDAKQPETGTQEEPGLGELFKRGRERLGLSVEQVVEITRLRKHFVEALENEDWDNLPSGVFVRGFIKAYAQIVGLDQKKAVSLYERSSHAESLPPKPLVKTSRARIGPILFLATLMVGIAVLILWILYPFSINSPLQPGTETSSEPRREPPVTLNPVEPEPSKPEVKIGTEKAVEAPKVNPAETPQQAQTPEADSSAVEAKEQPALNAFETTEREPGEIPDQTQFVLTGHVKERTWIRICVDDQEPKEYIFQPGSRPQWKGVHGFNILIGNAAGIEFDFNGDMYENLGELGKVVRLKLPKDFTGSKCEE
jgi:cytoskeleton protein RodZ